MTSMWGDVDYPPWMNDAACAQTDPEAFFPNPGAPNKAAKQVCASCPVTGECLGYALTHDERFGIWGGTSDTERRHLRRHPDGR